MDISFSEQDLQFKEEIRSGLENDFPSHIREKQNQGIALSKDERKETIKEAKEILDDKEVDASILLVEDLRIQKD